MKTVLETERLILRNFVLEDLDDLFEYASQEKVGPMAGWEPHTDKENTLKYLKKIINKPLQFAIVLKEENKVIGTVELMDCHKERFKNIEIEEDAKEIGCVLSEKYWQKGYMTEAIKEIIRYTFEELNVDVIYTCNASKNIGSSKVQEKCGFKQIGILPNDRKWIDGTMTDKIQRKLTKDDFYKRK